MKFRIFAIYFLLLIVSGIIGCDNGPVNQEQINFINNIKQLESEKTKLNITSFRGKDDSGRIAPEDISSQIKEIKQEILTLLNNPNIDAKQWYASVVSVKRNGTDLILHSAYGSQDYYLTIFDDKSKKIVEQLIENDKITFTGKLGPDTSKSLLGAISNQLFSIYPTSVQTSHGEITQMPTEVKRRIELDRRDAAAQEVQKQKANGEEELKDRIIEICKETLRSNMKYPESVSFSWFKRNFEKKSETEWIYRDVVEAKNDFGGELPARFECYASVAGDRIKVSVNILDRSN